MLKKIFIILLPILFTTQAYAITFEGIGNATTSPDGLYTCEDPEALNYLETTNEQNNCVYTPPTMYELIVINTSICAFASFVWLCRLLLDIKQPKQKRL